MTQLTFCLGGSGLGCTFCWKLLKKHSYDGNKKKAKDLWGLVYSFTMWKTAQCEEASSPRKPLSYSCWQSAPSCTTISTLSTTTPQEPTWPNCRDSFKLVQSPSPSNVLQQSCQTQGRVGQIRSNTSFYHFTCPIKVYKDNISVQLPFDLELI